MQSLTDRMAAALRRVVDDVSDLSNETLSAVHDALAEYDAERSPPQPAKISAGCRVRCTRASRKTRDYQAGDEAKVQYLAGDGFAVVTWLTDLGNNFGVERSALLRLDHCELVLNLPATNTGD